MNIKVIRQKVRQFIQLHNLELSETDKQALLDDVISHERKIEVLGAKLKASRWKDYYDKKIYQAYMQALEDYAAWERYFLENHGIYE